METDDIALRQESDIEAYDQGAEDEVFQSRLTAGVMGFLSVAGLICNVIVILIIYTLKEYKQSTHWYVLNLAVADSVFLVLLPFNLMQSLSGKWTFGLPLCVAFQGVFYVTYYAEVLFLAVMSFDRYVAIAHPISPSCRRIRSTRGSRLIAFAVWIVAISAAAPLMAKTTVDDVCDFSFEYVHPDCEANQISARYCDFWRKAQEHSQFGIKDSGNQSIEEFYYHNTEDGYENLYDDLDLPSESIAPPGFMPSRATEAEHFALCTLSNSRDYVTWIIGNFMLSFVVPLAVMAGCYGGILWKLRHRKLGKSIRKGINYSASKRRSFRGLAKKVRITILVVSLVAIFVVCWLPFHAVILAKTKGINLSAGACAKLEIAVLLIAYSNSLLNPLMYTFLGIRFNKRLKTTVSRAFHRTSVVRTESSKDGIKNTSKATTKFAKTSTSELLPARGSYIPMRLLPHLSKKRTIERRQHEKKTKWLERQSQNRMFE